MILGRGGVCADVLRCNINIFLNEWLRLLVTCIFKFRMHYLYLFYVNIGVHFPNFQYIHVKQWEISDEYPIFSKCRWLCHSAYFKGLLRCLCFNLGIDHLIGVRSVSLLGIVRDNLENTISAVSRSVGNLVWYCLELYWAPIIYGNIDDDTVQWLLVTPHRQSYLALCNKPGGVFPLFIIIMGRGVIV